jgi:Domain of unknown function (DUF4307)
MSHASSRPGAAPGAGRADPGVPRPRQVALLTVLGVAVAVAVGGLLWLGVSAARPAVKGGLLGYRVLGDAAVELRIEVVRDPGLGAVCLVRARDASGYEVARARVQVPAGGSRRRVVTYRLETSGRAVGGELLGCRSRGVR